MNINEFHSELPASYLFSEIAKRVAEYKANNPEVDVISLGIGDVTNPLPKSVIEALHSAVDDMGTKEGFHGYGPEQGYAFLRQAIADNDYKKRGVEIAIDEIFISDGSKCDVGNFQELFSADSKIAVTDPVYPVYVDSNAMSGRAGTFNGTNWSEIIYLPCLEENSFMPKFPEKTPDIIYLCYPNNPVGVVQTREELAKWVDYARKNKAIILYDSAYEAFITDDNIPHSIYEIEGAREVAVEFRSFSKTAGFTGLRCAYTVVPKELFGYKKDGTQVSLNAMWNRRQCTKYNGCPYIVQKGAAAIYTENGQAEVKAIINRYMENAATMREKLIGMGLTIFGGEHAPYIWVKTKNGVSSWDFFQKLLDECGVVCTPGAGFGPSGEGYVRLTAFADKERTAQALERMSSIL